MVLKEALINVVLSIQKRNKGFKIPTAKLIIEYYKFKQKTFTGKSKDN